MSTARFYPIGTPGVPWGDAERTAWRERQVRHRRHDQDVVPRVEALADDFEIVRYGELAYGDDRYPLLALKSRDWRPELPVALVTGGVHGYETSGVLGALGFAEDHAARYAGRVNLLVAPCVSPWAYERICRWNYHAVDPNRNFGARREAAVWYHGEPADGLILGLNRHGDFVVFADNWPDRARYWFPGVDHPSDKASVELEVVAPRELEVVGNGALAGRVDLPDGRARTR